MHKVVTQELSRNLQISVIEFSFLYILQYILYITLYFTLKYLLSIKYKNIVQIKAHITSHHLTKNSFHISGPNLRLSSSCHCRIQASMGLRRVRPTGVDLHEKLQGLRRKSNLNS